MRILQPKKLKTLRPLRSAVKTLADTKVEPLSKSHPDYFKTIGKRSAAKRNLSPEVMSEMAKLSHPRRDGYHGGRKKKSDGTTPPAVA